jgi:putative copper resistance protein D
MGESIVFWIHLLAAATWVGSQVFMFAAVVPALRTLDETARHRAVLVLNRRFAWLGWGALALLVLTGINNVMQRQDDYDIVFDYDFRYAWIFVAKLVLVGVVFALTAIHTYVLGPRLMALQEGGQADSEELSRMRRLSIVLSALNLLAGVAILFLVALLQNIEFSLDRI